MILFDGVSEYGLSVLFAGCFIIDEKIKSYQFALNSWIKAGFLIPPVIMSDRCSTLKSVIRSLDG